MRYKFYKWLQDYVHSAHIKQKAILSREFKSYIVLSPQARAVSRLSVLELACGGGDLSTLFPKEAYIGIDSSVDRIAAARRQYPGYRFEVCNINSAQVQDLLLNCGFIFCNAFLHHLNDQDCQALLERIRRLAPKPAVFVAIEPILPSALVNPLGFLLAKLDNGHYIRPARHYEKFFHNCHLQTELFSLFPRWPGIMAAYFARYDGDY